MIGQDPTSGSSPEEIDDVGASLAPQSLEEVFREDAPPSAPLPAPPRVPVSGRYRATERNHRLYLRVDVDGVRPQRKLSGDFFQVSGTTETYLASFIVDTPEVEILPDSVTIRGAGRFSHPPVSAPFVEVTIARPLQSEDRSAAIVRFSTTAGEEKSRYRAVWDSRLFRKITIERDRALDDDTEPFDHLETEPRPGVPSRSLSLVTAFAEAGIEIDIMPEIGVVDLAASGVDGVWSDPELDALMTTRFSLLRNSTSPVVWLFDAHAHEKGLLGSMFDQEGDHQRQGCAVFYQGLGGAAPDDRGRQLFTYMHELGHCFNLVHSWEKEIASPSGVNRPDALSFMNKPIRYPGGSKAFWERFSFRYDKGELIHLRHGFRDNVLMGGSPFFGGAALADSSFMNEPIADSSGLRFELIGVHLSFALGEPVVLQLGIRSAKGDSRRAHAHLHPNGCLTSIVIAKPNGKVVAYEPCVNHFFEVNECKLGERAIERSAYIGYGRGGHYFDEPGRYRVRAAYQALDGSTVFSNVATIRVRRPVSRIDDDVAALMLGDEQGRLLSLKGSDSEHLQRGNDAFKKLLDKYPTHPVADYVRFVKGHNWTRKFKSIDPSKPNRVRVRDQDLNEAAALLEKATCDSSRLDDISKSEALAGLAAAKDATREAGSVRPHRLP